MIKKDCEPFFLKHEPQQKKALDYKNSRNVKIPRICDTFCVNIFIKQQTPHKRSRTAKTDEFTLLTTNQYIDNQTLVNGNRHNTLFLRTFFGHSSDFLQINAYSASRGMTEAILGFWRDKNGIKTDRFLLKCTFSLFNPALPPASAKKESITEQKKRPSRRKKRATKIKKKWQAQHCINLRPRPNYCIKKKLIKKRDFW